MNYKSGDLVKITGNCNGHWFKIGEIVRLKYRLESFWAAEYLDGHDWWNVHESDMTPTKATAMPQKIVVTTDGKTTLARLFDGKTMVKRAEAKCAPSDVFDFGVGAELAVKRLMGEKPVTESIKESEPVKLYCVKSCNNWLVKGRIYGTDKCGRFIYEDGDTTAEKFKCVDDIMKTWLGEYLVPLVKRPAKVGEWVYLIKEPRVNTSHEFQCAYHKGDIVRIDFFGFFPSVKTNCAGGFSGFREDEYLVLDGYTGDPA